jgi:hypothetical protein
MTTPRRLKCLQQQGAQEGAATSLDKARARVVAEREAIAKTHQDGKKTALTKEAACLRSIINDIAKLND